MGGWLLNVMAILLNDNSSKVDKEIKERQDSDKPILFCFTGYCYLLFL
jgi:hypothetical protein